MAGEQTAAARLELEAVIAAAAAITEEADEGSVCGLEEDRAFGRPIA